MSPAFKPTAEQRESVELMISYGAPEAEICLLIKNAETGKPIEVETLREHFASEIATGATKLKSLLGNRIVAAMLGRALARPLSERCTSAIRPRDLIDADSILRDVATDDPQPRSGDRCSTSMSSVSNTDIAAGCSAGISASLMGLNPRSIASAGSCHLITRSLRWPIRSGVRQWQSRSVLVANRRKPPC